MQLVVKGNNHYSIQNATLNDVKGLIERAGNQIGSVHFVKRSTGELRKMAYRLHVTNPTNVKSPIKEVKSYVYNHPTSGALLQFRDTKGRFTVSPEKRIATHNKVQESNGQINVFDVNKQVIKDGKKVRGAYRTVPLEGVQRVVVNGVTYDIDSILDGTKKINTKKIDTKKIDTKKPVAKNLIVDPAIGSGKTTASNLSPIKPFMSLSLEDFQKTLDAILIEYSKKYLGVPFRRKI